MWITLFVIIAAIVIIIALLQIVGANGPDEDEDSEDVGYINYFKKYSMLGEIISEEILVQLDSYHDKLIAFTILDEEDVIFNDVEEAKKYATTNKLYQKLGYAIISRLLISPISTDYNSDEVVQRGEVVDCQEYLRYDKQLNVWKK